VNGEFAGLRGEHEALDADDVADVQQFFEHVVVERLVVARADVVAAHVDLHAAGGILDFGKRGVAHDAEEHDAPGQGNVFIVSLVFLVVLLNVRDGDVDVEGLGRERLDAQLLKVRQFLAPVLLLFT
jgi:hypothetical protein